MKRDQLTPEARQQLAFAAEQLRTAGINIGDDDAFESALRPITRSPVEPPSDILRDLAEWTASPAPRNRHERRKAAALSRRS